MKPYEPPNEVDESIGEEELGGGYSPIGIWMTGVFAVLLFGSGGFWRVGSAIGLAFFLYGVWLFICNVREEKASNKDAEAHQSPDQADGTPP